MIRFHRAVAAGANFYTRLAAHLEHNTEAWVPYHCVVLLGGCNDVHRVQEDPACVKATSSASSGSSSSSSGSGSSSISSDSGSSSISSGSGTAAVASAVAAAAAAVASAVTV